MRSREDLIAQLKQDRASIDAKLRYLDNLPVEPDLPAGAVVKVTSAGAESGDLVEEVWVKQADASRTSIGDNGISIYRCGHGAGKWDSYWDNVVAQAVKVELLDTVRVLVEPPR